MKIGINLLYLLPGIVGGTETYAAGLLNGLAGIDTKDKFVVFVNRESAVWPIPNQSNFSRVICPVNATSRSSRYFFEQFRLPLLLSKHRIDIIHSLGYVGPLLTPCFSVVTIPDLNFIALKHTLPRRKIFFLRFFSSQSVRWANRAITISNFSKKEISRNIKLEPGKITVTHLGSVKNDTSAHLENWEEVNEIYRISRPYIIAIGGGTLHKNIPRLIKAFDILKKSFPHSLVIMGRLPADVNLSVESIGTELKDRILTTGYVPEKHILPLLRNADLFVLPSLYEGFGLPVLEAQQAGVAVACSNAASLPEVAGHGALYFDPNSIEDIADAIECCLGNSDLRSQLILKGRENLSRFSWKETALKTLTVYQDLYGTSKID